MFGRVCFAERRAALETWTALLLEIERGERKVAPLRLRQQFSDRESRRLSQSHLTLFGISLSIEI
jgi:hypothetical protein